MRCFSAGEKSSNVIHSIDSSSRSIRRLVQTERQDFTYTRRPPPGPPEQRSRRCTEKEGITRKLSSMEFGWSYVSLKNIISLWVSDTTDSRREHLPNTLQQFSWEIIIEWAREPFIIIHREVCEEIGRSGIDESFNKDPWAGVRSARPKLTTA